MASLLDGRLVADSLLLSIHRRVAKLKKKKITPKLVILLATNNPASLTYIKQKEKAAQKVGIKSELMHLTGSITTKKIITAVERLNRDPSVHGILVQLPLPEGVQAPLVTRAIDPKKDVDGFHAYNLGKMFLAQEFEELVPCTPRGIIHLLDYYAINPTGKHAVIVGRSNIVGKPLSILLLARDATVTVCHSKTKKLAEITRQADILIAATGRPKMIKASMVKRGAVVIDVGITKVNNTLVGDVDFDNVKKKASFITPVPGGVGPMTVACLMENVVRAIERR